MSFIYGHGRYARGTYPERGRIPTPAPAARYWTPVNVAGPQLGGPIAPFAPIPGARIELTGYAGGDILGAWTAVIVGIAATGASEDLEYQFVLETDGGDVISPLLVGTFYTDNYHSTVAAAFSFPRQAGVGFEAILVEWRNRGVAENTADLTASELQAQEVSFT
jgi:hypothetical protein